MQKLKLIISFIKQRTFFFWVFFGILLLSRFVLLDQSARFIWDESDDLVRMHDIFLDKRITLVGPISENNINIYGSLTYYMFLPFAIFFRFDPIGPVVGMAFYSTVSMLLLGYIFHKRFQWSWAMATLFLLVLLPYLQSGRWAWNPHLVPFWEIISLSLFFLLKEKKWYHWIMIGLTMGLGIHNHWYAVFATAGFGIITLIYAIKDKKYLDVLWYGLGVICSIVPFVIFDLMRPPGLFLTRFYIFSSMAGASGGATPLVNEIGTHTLQFFDYFFKNKTITGVFITTFALYVTYIVQFHRNTFKFIFLIPVMVQILGLSMLSITVYDHYLLPAVVFFLIFLAIPDKKKQHSFMQKSLLVYMLIFSIVPAWREIHKDEWSTNIDRTRNISQIIVSEVGDMKCNIFAPASEDPSTTGKKYRDVVKIYGKILLPKEDYGSNDCLFVVSTSDLKKIQADKAYELDRVRNLKPTKQWEIEDDWKLYLFKID